MTCDQHTIKTRIMALIEACDTGKTICPTQVARTLSSNNEKEWRLLMKPVRQVSIMLATEGKVLIKRKGKPVNPLHFKGIYRLGLPD